SIAACHAITSAANSSFPVAFRLLSPARRRAMDALYAYMRVTDDLADEPGGEDQKRAKLAAWRASLSAALAGEFAHPIPPALADRFRALMRFEVSRARDYYRRGSALVPLLSRDGRAIFHVMSGAYSRLLDEIERADYDVFARRVRVSKWRKIAVCASGWLV